MITEFDGKMIRLCASVSTRLINYAMKTIHPADEQTLLEVIFCTKFKGKAMIPYARRDITVNSLSRN